MRIFAGIYLLLAAIATAVSYNCGITAPNANPSDANTDRIGGEIFPWVVAIYKEDSDHDWRKCFGNLISSDVVITESSCMSGSLHQVYVVSGNYTPRFLSRDRLVSRTRVEARYRGKKYDAWNESLPEGIAWLVLEDTLNVTPACIDLENRQDTAQLPVGLVGKHSVFDARGKLHTAEIEVIDESHSDCDPFFAEVRRRNVSPNASCARPSSETQAFSGYTGGGFYVQQNGRWYLRGIITNWHWYNRGDDNYIITEVKNVQHYVDQINGSGAIKRCGIAASLGNPLIVHGFGAELGRYPWHIGVYRRNSVGLYDSICAGSLISTKVVLSAAHCFFDEGRRRQQSVSRFAVAGGKFYRLYNWPEKLAQQSSIKTIHIPSRYYGTVGNYAEDIAWLILLHPFYYSALVTPVCIDFDNSYRNEDFRDGQVGKIAGWGRTAANILSNELQEMNAPFVPYERCILALPQDFIKFVTSDKFCVGYTNGSRLCDGDSGGGLVFSHGSTWYLRGIVSNGPPSAESACAASYTLLTDVGHFNDEHRRIMNISTGESN